jgi:hypothetical protein
MSSSQDFIYSSVMRSDPLIGISICVFYAYVTVYSVLCETITIKLYEVQILKFNKLSL